MWAMANFEVIGFMENEQLNKINDDPGGNYLVAHIVSAVTGKYMLYLRDHRRSLTCEQVSFDPYP